MNLNAYYPDIDLKNFNKQMNNLQILDALKELDELDIRLFEEFANRGLFEIQPKLYNC